MANKPARFGLAAAILAFGATAGAFAQPPAPEAPAPPADARWIVDESGDTCAMARAVAAGPLTLMVTTYPGSGEYDLKLVTASWRSGLRRNSQRASLALLPTSTSFDRRVWVTNMPGGRGEALNFGALPADFLEQFGRTAQLRVTVDGRAIGTYQVPQAEAVARVFADCEANKLLEWGADPAGVGPGTTRPRPIGDRHGWVDTQALRRAEERPAQIMAIARLTLNREGRPERCDLTASNLSAAAAPRVCEALMRAARYQPGRDRNGNPVPSIATYELNVTVFTRDESRSL